MAIFPTFFFQVIQARKMSFAIFQNEKTPFQPLKTRSLKSRKIDILPNGLTYGFGPKMAYFPPFFFQAIQARTMSFMVFQNEKTPFQTIKTTSSKSRKLDIFAKRLTHGFGPKMTDFATFFLQAIQTRKMSFTIFQNTKRLSRLRKEEVRKVEKLTFFQRG